jgi:small-conductance mechanosensitive channel
MDRIGKLLLASTLWHRRSYALRATVGIVLLMVGIAAPVVSVPQQGGEQSSTTTAAKGGGAQTQPTPAEPVLPLSSDEVAGHLGKTADWYHHLEASQQLQTAAADSGAKDRLHQQALTAVRLAVEFGKACAALLNQQAQQAQTNPAPAGSSKGFAGRLDEAAASVEQRIDALQSQLDTLNGQIAKTRGKARQSLLAKKGEVSAALELAREVRESVQDMEDFEASSIAGDQGNLSPIEGRIVAIERSIPELRPSLKGSRGRRGATASSGPSGGSAPGGGSSGGGTSGSGNNGGGSGVGSAGSGTGGGSSSSASGGGSNSAAGGGSMKSASASPLRIESAGVIALIGEWFSLSDLRRQLSAAIKETDALQDEIGKLRASLVGEVRDLVGKDLGISTLTDPVQLLAQRQALEVDTRRFKQLSTVLVPLGEQALTVESAATTLADWRSALSTRTGAVARYLALRVGIVVGWIALVLVISDLWKRATFRYLHDLRRRRQFLILRRVVVAIALTLAIVFGLVSEIGSLATYIGFLTAGIAVALQNVILAVVAYFFLIGRYGVRVGDRITMAGVTGRVAEVGLMRLYLMELSGADLHATGRMVVLSNAVLFQPQAMFKQIPGADYVWHTVTLTVAATADVAEAHKRLKAASDAVYEKYRPAIERQHAMMQRFMDFESAAPQPEVRVRLTENGLECSVRYPVELENAAVIDQQMLKASRDALEQDSQFKLVSTGAVVLKSSES